MRPRSLIYAEILHFGLREIREAAHLGHAKQCEVEADHLHNVPTLFDEDNEERHIFYIKEEVQLYLDRLKQVETGPSGFTLARYEDLWAELREHCGMEGS